MSDIYYQPRRSQYRSQYVPMPLDFMQKALEAKQAKWNATQEALDELSETEFNALKGEDTKKTQAVKKEIDDFVDASVNRDIGSSEFNRELNQLVRKIKNDKGLQKVTNNYNEVQELLELKEKWIAEDDPNKYAPEVWNEAEKRIEAYTSAEGKGYLGDIDLLGVGDITGGVDIREKTANWFDEVSKDTDVGLDPAGWGWSYDRMTSEAEALYSSWLSSVEGRQYLKRYDQKNGYWSGNVAEMSREKNKTVLDADGNPTDKKISEYDEYILDKNRDAYRFFQDVALQKVGQKRLDGSGPVQTKTEFNKDSSGENVKVPGLTTAEQVSDYKEGLEDYRNTTAEIRRLEELSTQEDLSDLDKEKLENLKNYRQSLKEKSRATYNRIKSVDDQVAVDLGLADNIEDVQKIQAEKENILKNSEYKDELNETLNGQSIANEILEQARNEIRAEIDKLPPGEAHDRLIEYAQEHFHPDSFGGELYNSPLTGVFDATEVLEWFLPATIGTKLYNYIEGGNADGIAAIANKYILKLDEAADNLIADATSNEETVRNKSNQMDAFFEKDDYTYKENTDYREDDKVLENQETVNQGEKSVWVTNQALMDFQRSDEYYKWYRAEQGISKEDLLKDLKNKLDAKKRGIGTINYSEEELQTAYNAVSELYDMKGDLTWNQFENKKNDYHDVSEALYMDDKVKVAKFDENGKWSDSYNETFNKIVPQTEIAGAEVLYKNEKEYLNEMYKPDTILETAIVTDSTGATIDNEKLREMTTLEIPENAEFKVIGTNWDKRYLNRDKSGNFNYTGTLNVKATWIDDGKPQEYEFTTPGVKINTGNKVDPEGIKSKLISIKANELNNIDAQFKRDMNTAIKQENDDLKIQAINRKVRNENENMLEISMLEDPEFYRNMKDVTKTFNANAYYKLNADGTYKHWSIPSVSINRYSPDGNIQDNFKIVKIQEGPDRNRFMIDFTSTFDGQRSEEVKEGPFNDYNAALNVIYNYRIEAKKHEAKLKLDKDAESMDAGSTFTDISDEIEI